MAEIPETSLSFFSKSYPLIVNPCKKFLFFEHLSLMLTCVVYNSSSDKDFVGWCLMCSTESFLHNLEI